MSTTDSRQVLPLFEDFEPDVRPVRRAAPVARPPLSAGTGGRSVGW